MKKWKWFIFIVVWVVTILYMTLCLPNPLLTILIVLFSCIGTLGLINAMGFEIVKRKKDE